MTQRLLLAIVAILVCGLVMAGDQERPFALAEKDQNEAYRKMLPNIKDEHLKNILADRSLIFYTDTEIPKAHQDWEGLLQGVLDSRENVSGNRSEPFGNGNKEFPWGTPAGTHLSDGITTLRFILLPRDEKGKMYPVVYYQTPKTTYGQRTLKDGTIISTDERHNREGWAWTFPKGTVVGEILMLSDSSGTPHAFEIRTRTRNLEKWVVNAYRPFPTAKDLVAGVKKLDGWEKNKRLTTLVAHLEEPLSATEYTLADTQPDKSVFSQKRHQDFLPAIDEEAAVSLLDKTPFSSALGAIWRGKGELAPHAPTTEAGFHVVPKKYTAGFIDVTSNSCMQCHKETNQHVNEFDIRRDWYGRIRGSDGIFSFHPFDPSCITRSGGRAVTFNKKMVDAGVIAEFSSKIHPDTIYQRLSNVR